MFGLFGKSEFDKEMEKIDAEIKVRGKELLLHMQQYNLSQTASTMQEMNDLYEKQINLCKKHGKLEKINQLKALQDKIKSLIG
jgi:hypothetical protein